MAEDIKDPQLDNSDEGDQKIYEIGYLLVPFLPSDKLGEAVTASIKSAIESLGGVVTSEMEPSMIRLAYTIRKTLANKINKFNDAYFGALRFKLTSDKTPELKEKLDKNENLIRFLILALPKGSEMISIPKRTYQRREEKPFEIERKEKPAEVETGEAKPEMTKEDIDKEIESLLVEPQK